MTVYRLLSAPGMTFATATEAILFAFRLGISAEWQAVAA